MKLLEKIQKLFKVETTEVKPEPKTLQTLDVFDDVWVLKNNEKIKGWVFGKTKNTIMVVTEYEDFKFHYTRPLTVTSIENNNIKLLLNESDSIC